MRTSWPFGDRPTTRSAARRRPPSASTFIRCRAGPGASATAAPPGPRRSGGARVYTQSLIVPPDVLHRFANNPFALLRAARAKNLLTAHDPLPAVLAPLQLPGRAAALDEGLVGELVDRWGPRRLAWLLQSVLAADPLVIVGAENADWLLAGLLNCLPIECRPELSFATGLTVAQRRPYRVNAITAEAAERQRLARQGSVTLLNVSEAPPDDFEAGRLGRVFEKGSRVGSPGMAGGRAEPSAQRLATL